MFATYPLEATKYNWVHEAIYAAFKRVCILLNENSSIPTWPEIFPLSYREKFRRRHAFKSDFENFINVATASSEKQRNHFIYFFRKQNEIDKMLSNKNYLFYFNVTFISDLVEAAKPIMHRGFDMLDDDKVLTRKKHYNTLYSKSKMCPFCALEIFNYPSSFLHKEDYDHYLDKEKYPLAAANFKNLVPMCKTCNQRYKRTEDTLFKDSIPRKAFFPYGKKFSDINLLDSDPLNDDYLPRWVINFSPECERTETWDEVFKIRDRVQFSVLKAFYSDWLTELCNFLKNLNKLSEKCTDDELIKATQGVVEQWKQSRRVGVDFYKCKVGEMWLYHLPRNPHLLKMIKSGLE